MPRSLVRIRSISRRLRSRRITSQSAASTVAAIVVVPRMRAASSTFSRSIARDVFWLAIAASIPRGYLYIEKNDIRSSEHYLSTLADILETTCSSFLHRPGSERGESRADSP